MAAAAPLAPAPVAAAPAPAAAAAAADAKGAPATNGTAPAAAAAGPVKPGDKIKLVPPPRAKVVNPYPDIKAGTWNGLDPEKDKLPKPDPPEDTADFKGQGWKTSPLIYDERVTEDFECEKVDGVDSRELLEMCKITEISDDVFKLWGSFQNKDQLQSPLKTVVDHAETSKNTTFGLRDKLRYVTKKIKEQWKLPPAERTVDPAGIFVMLAVHGNMCNIQKEVGIGVAYSMVNNTLKSDMDKQSMHSLLVRLLFNYRLQVMEELYLKLGSSKNNHYLNSLTNDLHVWNGLPVVPDDPYGPDTFREVRVTADVIKEWYSRYTVTNMVKHVSAAMSGKHKKIPYETQVRWYQDHAPPGVDKYDFLSDVFDENTGLVKPKYVLYLLHAHYAVQGPGVEFVVPADATPVAPAAAAAAPAVAGAAAPTAAPVAGAAAAPAAAAAELKMHPAPDPKQVAAQQAALANAKAKAEPNAANAAAAIAAEAHAAAVAQGLYAVPHLKRQVSAHEDVKMPPMVRKVSLDEERAQLMREESLKAQPARKSKDGACQCHQPLGHCVCLSYVANMADAAAALARDHAAAAAMAAGGVAVGAGAAVAVAKK